MALGPCRNVAQVGPKVWAGEQTQAWVVRDHSLAWVQALEAERPQCWVLVWAAQEEMS